MRDFLARLHGHAALNRAEIRLPLRRPADCDIEPEPFALQLKVGERLVASSAAGRREIHMRLEIRFHQLAARLVSVGTVVVAGVVIQDGPSASEFPVEGENIAQDGCVLRAAAEICDDFGNGEVGVLCRHHRYFKAGLVFPGECAFNHVALSLLFDAGGEAGRQAFYTLAAANEADGQRRGVGNIVLHLFPDALHIRGNHGCRQSLFHVKFSFCIFAPFRPALPAAKRAKGMKSAALRRAVSARRHCAAAFHA